MELACYWTLPCGAKLFFFFFFFYSVPPPPNFFKNLNVFIKVFVSRVETTALLVLSDETFIEGWTHFNVNLENVLFNLCKLLQILERYFNFVFFSCVIFLVSGLSQRSLRVCQAKRVAPPIVPESATSSGQQQQQHRHSGSSFDSGGSAESSSGGYCSGTGSLSSCHAPSSSAWSQSGSDQRSSIGLDDAFLPPPPSSPAAHSNNNAANKHHHMYSRGNICRDFLFKFSLHLPALHSSHLAKIKRFIRNVFLFLTRQRHTCAPTHGWRCVKWKRNFWGIGFFLEKRDANRPQHSNAIGLFGIFVAAYFHIQISFVLVYTHFSFMSAMSNFPFAFVLFVGVMLSRRKRAGV